MNTLMREVRSLNELHVQYSVRKFRALRLAFLDLFKGCSVLHFCSHAWRLHFLEQVAALETRLVAQHAKSLQSTLRSPHMKVTRRRASIEDVEVLLALINAAYKHEGKWKVEEKRTSATELCRLIPDQDSPSSSGDFQVLMVLLADEGEDVSCIPESAQYSRIVGHIRYVFESGSFSASFRLF